MNELDEPMSFEQALLKLELIVRELESNDTGLDRSLERYEIGVGLLKRCRSILDEAERKIRLVTRLDATGSPVTQPFDVTLVAPGDSTQDCEQPAAAERTISRPRRSAAEPPERGDHLF
jgi:exodeoxyribonuclease VII small subunit